MSLTLASLFDGIGGFPLAFARAGVRTVATVEIDKAAAAISRRHFPDAHQFDDVTKVTGDDLRAVGFVPGRGILTAGWPCQDFSVAGRRAGLAGERSGLWWHVARILDELRPLWFVGENVPDSCHRCANAQETEPALPMDIGDHASRESPTTLRMVAASAGAWQRTVVPWVPSSGRWLNSGMGSPTEFWTLSSSASPSNASVCSLSDILEPPGEHLRRYYLSPKAAAGILRRAAKRGRTLPEPLWLALTRLAERGHPGLRSTP